MKRRSDIYIRGMVSDNKVTKFKLRKYVIDVRHLTMIDGLLIMNINIYIHINKPSIIRLEHVIGMLVWEATQYNGQTPEVAPPINNSVHIVRGETINLITRRKPSPDMPLQRGHKLSEGKPHITKETYIMDDNPPITRVVYYYGDTRRWSISVCANIHL